jgi:uncharacterized membrane protein YuzA (DUF378 family)
MAKEIVMSYQKLRISRNTNKLDRGGFTMEKQISVFRRVVYICFGFCGMLGVVKSGIWYGSILATIFHTLALIAATNWGVVGITGKDIVEWIEIALKKI